MLNGVHVDQFGNQRYYLNGLLHRNDGPAAIYSSGYQQWFEHGKLHRIGGPAVTFDDNHREEWWINNQRHRIGGPAVICTDCEEWYKNDYLHRLDGPAVICTPCIGFPNGLIEWWISGLRLNCTTQNEFEQLVKLKAFW